MAVARTPRERWIEEGLRALAAGGPDAVRVEPLALALGVTKGGFYGYFANRPALLEEILDRWESDTTDRLIEQVETAGGDAKERLGHLVQLVSTGASLSTDVTVDLAVRAWARRDSAVADRLRRVDNRRMDYLRSLFSEFCSDPDEVEVRCRLMFTSYIGEHFMLVDHGDRTESEMTALTMKLLIDV